MRFYTSRFVVSAPYFARVLFNANVFLYGESIIRYMGSLIALSVG